MSSETGSSETGVRAENTGQGGGEPAHVIVVDDDPDQRVGLGKLLEAEGHRVSLASSGEALLELAAADAPDLVLLDVSMPPGIDGYEACRLVRDRGEPPPMVVFLSAGADTEDAVEGLDLGGHDYIAKPFSLQKLYAKVRSALRAKRMVDELWVQATVDPLTGLANRGQAIARGEALVRIGERYGRPFGCLMVDVDHFKAVNDTHGHAAGDAVLRQLAWRMVATCRRPDQVFRLGGEEFLALVPETDLAGARQLGERIRMACEERGFAIPLPDGQEGERRVTLSAGVACWRAGQTLAQLMQAADRALYTAKRQGRNRVVAQGDSTGVGAAE